MNRDPIFNLTLYRVPAGDTQGSPAGSA